MVGHTAYPLGVSYDNDTDSGSGFGPLLNNPALNSFTVARNTIASKPEVVYVVAGTNPLGGSEADQSFINLIVQEMERGIREIAELSPDSYILLGAVPPSLTAPNTITRYNQLQKELALQLQSDGLKIDYWDAEIAATEMLDALHMTVDAMTRFGQEAFSAGEQYFMRSGACS